MEIARTNTTSLSDDELILLDVMFNGGATFRLLRREVFKPQWNYESHNLTDDQLRDTLERFVHCGLVMTGRGSAGQYFQLTPDGGRQWELERLPAWDRFAMERYGETLSGRPFVSITATSSQIRDDFWRIGCKTNMFAYRRGRIKRSVIRNHSLIRWKQFLKLYVVTAVLDDWLPSTDWQVLEAKRTWWRGVRENEKFWRRSA